MMIHVARHTLRVCMTTAGILLIVLALFTASARLGLPFLANYKGTVESRVSQYLKSPVEIGDLSFKWEGVGPLLLARQVTVLESDQRKVTLDELLIDVNLPKSLLRGVPVINELTLLGADLAIEADEEGRWHLHGVESVTGKAVDPEARRGNGVDIMAWLLTASKVGLLDTRVSITDRRSNRSLLVEHLNIRAENAGKTHKLRVEMDLPGDADGALEAGIDLVGEAGSLAQSDGDLYLRTDALQVSTIAELLSIAQAPESAGQLLAPWDTEIFMELWGRWEDGQLISAHGPVRSSAIVDTVSGEQLLQGASAVLDLFVTSESLALETDELLLNGAADDTRIEDLSVLLERETVEGSGGWEVDARGEKLSLSTFSGLSSVMLSSLRPELAQQLRHADLQGWLRNWDLSAGQRTTGARLTARADLDQLQWQPVGALPGMGPINGRVDLDDLQGEVSVSADAMNLPWPAYSEAPLHLDSLKSVLTLDARDTQRVQIGADIAMADAGIDTSTRLKATLIPGQAPHLDVQSQYEVADLNGLKKWLPRKAMGAGLQNWFDRAIEGGSASNGNLLFFGNTDEFPFREGEGVFRSSVELHDGQLSFLPDWPTARDINGTVELDGLTLEGRATDSRLGEFDITQTHVKIADLTAAVLELEGTGQGKLQKVVDFANSGPLGNILEPVLNDVTGRGDTALDLQLAARLYQPRNAEGAAVVTTPPLQVDGSFFLQDNRLAFGRADMTLENVTGAIGFDENGIRINNLRAKALDQPVSVSGRTEGQGENATTRVTISGALQGSEGLAHYGSQLDQFLRGTSSWDIELTAPHSASRIARDGVILRLSSDLVGSELLLPKPYYKSTATAADIELQTAFREDQEVQEWQINYADTLAVNARVRNEELESLLIHVGSGQIPDTLLASAGPGIHLQGSAGTVAVDGWAESIAQFIDSIPDNGEAPTEILPIVADLEIESLQIGQRLLGPATLQLDTDDTYLNARVESRSLSGTASYPREHWTKETPMQVRLRQLDSTVFTALASRSDDELLNAVDDDLDPRLWPPVDATISRLTHGDYTLRDLALRAQPDVSGLTITTLGFAYETATLVGQGYWRLRDPQNTNPKLAGQQISQLNLVMQSSDLGEALQSVGLTEVLSEGQGSIEARLDWPGPIYGPELAEIDGSIKMDIERGNIIPLEPGAGRMVGLFALQALPRRLDFDFKDVTADGLAFESITGDIDIHDGIADTTLVQLTGPIGVVDITGQSDIVNQEFDQKVTILPRVSAALPLIGVISGGATAGVGALVATGFLKAIGIDLDRLGLRNYSLTGKWDDPLFEAVDTDYRHRQ